ncbi:uncharacterized protein LOC115200878 [Salmo trutta]|uniref:uncharacterized protein LOC115200878 n=1 Tax=Salmo trutta TaxID=8032 RepID=UPI00113113E6|nr:uncharacterized protein LOC115200878 [Salmo trutta]
MMADIEGMFHQVRVHEDDLDFLRFLWWPDGDTNKRLEEYRMTVHLFGAISSPSCANFALRKTAEDNCERYDEEVIQTVKSNFYVDDCLKSVATEEQAIALTKNLMDVCSQGGFKLTKWVGNSRAVLASIPDEHKAKQIKELDLDREKLPVERALGIRWNIERDAFTFRVIVKNRPLTRRGILSTVSSVYDPLGFLAPFVLKAKQILQVLCKLKCGWDEVIPEEHSISWKRWLSELDQLSRFQIDRCMMPENFGQVKTAQLHHFGDASEQCYGTASYLRFTNGMGKVHIAFILGKSRVTPLKQMTIPRLELAAATLAVRVDRMLRRMQARAGEQKMADLPQDRVSPDLPPFTHVGIDYFGPIEVKRGRVHVKRALRFAMVELTYQAEMQPDQYALNGAPVEHCEGTLGQANFLQHPEVKSRCHAFFTTVSVWFDRFSCSDMCMPKNLKFLTISTAALLMRVGACPWGRAQDAEGKRLIVGQIMGDSCNLPH